MPLDFITVLTSDVIRAHMSKPSDKGLTVSQKADLIQPQIQWVRIEGAPFSLSMESPASRETYVVSFDENTYQVSCTCKASGWCKHSECFKREWLDMMVAAAKANRPSVYSASPSSSPSAVSAATFASDWM